jgi:hypothetical protein
MPACDEERCIEAGIAAIRYRPGMNPRWHERHVLPRNAKLDERIAWHTAHQKHCGCRPIPARLREQMRTAGTAPRPRTAK